MKLHKTPFLSHFFSTGIFFLAVLFLVPSCGKKGPPIVPVKEGNVLAAPDNVTASLEQDQLTLTWTHTIDPVAAKLLPEAFEVYMATKDVEACQGCPFVFTSMGVISMPDRVYRRALEPGFHYYFRVRAIGRDKMTSEYSKTCYVDFTN